MKFVLHRPRAIAASFAALLLMTVALAVGQPAAGTAQRPGGLPPELQYLKEVNSWGPPADPQLLFLLMAQYGNAGRAAEGASYLDELRRRFDPQLTDIQRALYLTAIASLRGQAAGKVFLLRRIGWVRDTLSLLDEADRLSRGQIFITHWTSGLVRAQLPSFFGQRDQAISDLQWCLQHADKAPHPGWLREVYFQLAGVHRARGDAVLAERYQSLSGYTALTKPAVFTTPYTEDPATGHSFAPRRVREIVAGSVYLVSGYEFTEYYFIVSADRHELIAVDAGSRADAAHEAMDALRATVPGLPPLTTVLITHAHWDHVGGQRYFRSLQPAPRFIGRGNYAQELAKGAGRDTATFERFFGKSFRIDDVLAYKPDVAVDRTIEVAVGGTRLRLIPAASGETDDAMFIHLPEHGVLFVGDAFMPYLGAPFLEEGGPEGLLAAIDQVSALKPRVLLHGHEPLTRTFDSAQVLDGLRPQLAWLHGAVLHEMSLGHERAAVQQANLMPPELSRSSPRVHLAYLLLRENAINRIFDQHSGYWQNGLKGLDALTDADHGSALVDYLGVSETQLGEAVRRMVADGHHELAAQTLRWARARLPRTEHMDELQRLVHLKLMEKYQEFSPFKFILYAAQIDQGLPAISAPAAAGRPVDNAAPK
jgi:glyoxylase-like metal-dependent hydrolase (beta-lactamase superfamily II)